jgi:hypothetical protein
MNDRITALQGEFQGCRIGKIARDLAQVFMALMGLENFIVGTPGVEHDDAVAVLQQLRHQGPADSARAPWDKYGPAFSAPGKN